MTDTVRLNDRGIIEIGFPGEAVEGGLDEILGEITEEDQREFDKGLADIEAAEHAAAIESRDCFFR